MERRGGSGSPRTYADDERTQEVGQSHSTSEVSEQGRATGGGGGGGKGTGQGEPAPAKRAPGLSAGRVRPVRWSGCVWQQRVILCAPLALLPEARAGCGNAARPDPWRGSWATMIPTPTPLGEITEREAGCGRPFFTVDCIH